MSVTFGVGLQAAVTMDHKLIRKTNDIETFYERGDESQPIADTKDRNQLGHATDACLGDLPDVGSRFSIPTSTNPCNDS